MEQHRKPENFSQTRNYLSLPKINLSTQSTSPAELTERYGSAAAFALGMQFELELAGIKPEYKGGKRDSLQTRPGILFANHPSGFDVPLIINALVSKENKIRDDFSMLVKETEYPEWKKDFGDKIFLPATHDNFEVPVLMRNILKRINNGELFIIFPSYDSERTSPQMALKHKIIFERGLIYLVEHLNDDTMVYSIGIDRQQAENADSGIITPKINVSEHYSTAKDWREIINSSGEVSNEHKAFLMAEAFVNLHGLDYNPTEKVNPKT